MRSTGGIVLYLDQEGRGLGLLNKIRAYRLQDSGLDTIDANMTLGFENDERDYLVAARMLQLLGCKRVVLMTNNPVKIANLSRAGIEVCGRMPLQVAMTTKNVVISQPWQGAQGIVSTMCRNCTTVRADKPASASGVGWQN